MFSLVSLENSQKKKKKKKKGEGCNLSLLLNVSKRIIGHDFKILIPFIKIF